MKISISGRVWKKVGQKEGERKEAGGSGQMKSREIDVITSLGVSYHDYVDMKISFFRKSLEKVTRSREGEG